MFKSRRKWQSSLATTPKKSNEDGWIPSLQRAKRRLSVWSKNGGVTLGSPQMQSFPCAVFLGLPECGRCSAFKISTSRSGWGKCKLTQHLLPRPFFKWQKLPREIACLDFQKQPYPPSVCPPSIFYMLATEQVILPPIVWSKVGRVFLI